MPPGMPPPPPGYPWPHSLPKMTPLQQKKAEKSFGIGERKGGDKVVTDDVKKALSGPFDEDDDSRNGEKKEKPVAVKQPTTKELDDNDAATATTANETILDDTLDSISPSILRTGEKRTVPPDESNLPTFPPQTVEKTPGMMASPFFPPFSQGSPPHMSNPPSGFPMSALGPPSSGFMGIPPVPPPPPGSMPYLYQYQHFDPISYDGKAEDAPTIHHMPGEETSLTPTKSTDEAVLALEALSASKPIIRDPALSGKSPLDLLSSVSTSSPIKIIQPDGTEAPASQRSCNLILSAADAIDERDKRRKRKSAGVHIDPNPSRRRQPRQKKKQKVVHAGQPDLFEQRVGYDDHASYDRRRAGYDPTLRVARGTKASWQETNPCKSKIVIDEQTELQAKQAIALAHQALQNPKLGKQLLLSMALVRNNPRTPPSSYPAHGTVLTDRFHWAHYPPLDIILRNNMEQYYRLSTDKCQSRDQQEFNNGLVIKVKAEAVKYGWEFDPKTFDDKKIRDRIRCFYKTHIQNAKKRLKTMLRNPEKRANIKALANHSHLLEDNDLLAEENNDLLEDNSTSQSHPKPKRERRSTRSHRLAVETLASVASANINTNVMSSVEEVDEDVIRGAEDLISPSRVVQLESNPFGLELANEQPSAVKSARNVLL